MKTLIIFFAIACTLSCRHRAKTISHEKGVVAATQYTAAIDASGSGIGYSTSSRGGGPVITHVHVHEDEKYMVVFKCEHDVVFSINDAKLYAKLNQGDSVIIDYYDILNSDNEVIDLQFIDANKSKSF